MLPARNFKNFTTEAILGNNISFPLAIFIFIFWILTILLLPFYEYINKLNEDREKDLPQFPITSHFCKMIRMSCMAFISVYISAAIAWFSVGNNVLLTFLGLITSIIVVYALVISIQAFQFLLSILAIQKFILYFFPVLEPYFPKNMTIKYIYYVFGIKELVCLCVMAYKISKCAAEAKCEGTYQLYLIVLFASYSSTICSACLYFPILISVSKYSHLPAYQMNKPHKYIFWQTMIVLVVKSISLLLILYFIYFEIPAHFIIELMMVMDMMTTPLLIEVSYLTCNKRNLDVLCSRGAFVEILRLMVRWKSRKIEPAPVRLESTL